MHFTLATVVIVAAVLVTGWALVQTLRNRPMTVPLLAGLGVLELLVLVQGGVAVARLIGGQRPEEFATFLGYLIGVVLIPPAAAYLGLAERSRWGSAVIIVAGFAVAVMTGRLIQIWQGG
ncbi:MAG: hypothetical protein GEV11_11510 [Streptosporangiales bacterium]|nr:hypothetical protein [Streptosporangiales bacterium]